MELKDFIEKFAEQYEDTPINMFSKDFRFREVDEWSSLVAVCIISMIDDEYGVILTGEDIRNSFTIEDVYNIVKSRIA